MVNKLKGGLKVDEQDEFYVLLKELEDDKLDSMLSYLVRLIETEDKPSPDA